MGQTHVQDRGLAADNLLQIAELFGDVSKLKFGIGRLDTDSFNGASIRAFTNSKGEAVLKIAGKGVAGNATVVFANNPDAAANMEETLSTFQSSGMLEDLLAGAQSVRQFSGVQFQALAELIDAADGVTDGVTAKFGIGSVSESGLSQNTARIVGADGTKVKIGGGGLGGSANVTFSSRQEAETFEAVLDALELQGKLDDFFSGGVLAEDVLDLLDWSVLAQASGATESFSNVLLYDQDAAGTAPLEIFAEEDAPILVETADGFRGFAEASFDRMSDAARFEDIAEALIAGGLAGDVFDLV